MKTFNEFLSESNLSYNTPYMNLISRFNENDINVEYKWKGAKNDYLNITFNDDTTIDDAIKKFTHYGNNTYKTNKNVVEFESISGSKLYDGLLSATFTKDKNNKTLITIRKLKNGFFNKKTNKLEYI